MTFHAEMKKIGHDLSSRGHLVEIPQLLMDDGTLSIREFIKNNGGLDRIARDHEIWKRKARAIDDHFVKISWSDAILVANYTKHGIDGYIGGNTLMEIFVARYLNKKIFIMFPVSSDLSYAEEVFGVEPTILHEDVALVR